MKVACIIGLGAALIKDDASSALLPAPALEMRGVVELSRCVHPSKRNISPRAVCEETIDHLYAHTPKGGRTADAVLDVLATYCKQVRRAARPRATSAPRRSGSTRRSRRCATSWTP